MKKRIIDNWKTSLIALFIVLIMGVLLYFDKVTWEESLGFLTLSGLLAWVKDTIFKVDPDGSNQ